MSLEETHIKRGVSEISVVPLSASIKGQVITPDDTGYDQARTVFYGGFDRRPAAIVRVLDANDVSQVVTFAQSNNIELAVRGGGHSIAGHSVSEGGIVLDLSQMKGLDIDVENRTAWAEAGLTAGEYTTKTAAYGLATGFGDTASVGIAGLTLGGGVGYFVRKYGLTIDNLLAAEIVTADGEIRYIDADTHPDLFWAIRGGGGNFGVVTRFQYRLHEVDRVVGGILILPASPEILRAAVEVAENASEDLSAIMAVMVAPPMPFIPAEYHGQLITMIMPVHVGDIDAGLNAVAKFREIATPIADMLRPMSYPEIYPPDQEDFHPTAVSRNMFIKQIDEHATDVIFDYLGKSTAQVAVAQIRVLGGAMARVPVEATAFAHRNQPIMASVAALYQNPDEVSAHETWVTDFAETLRQENTGAYSNFLGAEGEARVREAYPGATWERLTAIKAKYDPTNLFRLNQNIPPAK